jgi:serine/threonine protein kinase
LDDVEDIEKYRFGGYHPVNLHDILGSRYEVMHKLGHGGFAAIWLARVLKENRYVALKILMADAPNNELKVLTYLRDHGTNHPNIASLKDTFTIQGPNGLHQCLVLDVAGPSLKRMADGKHQLSGPVAGKAGQQIAEGLAHLHSTGICHGGKISSTLIDSHR